MSRSFLERASRRLNILVTGGTGSGKTTLLNVLSAFISRGSESSRSRTPSSCSSADVTVVRLETPAAQHRGRAP